MAAKKEDTRPALSERGEFAMTLDGQQFILRPSFESIAAVEAETGLGLVELARASLEGRLSLSTTAQVVTQFIRAWGRSADDKGAAGVNASRIAELIMESEGGFHAALNTLSAVLAVAVTGGVTASGELKAATKKTMKAAPVAA